jgi:TPR repeat protein
MLMFLLWEKGTEESCGEAVRIAEKEASEENPAAYYWLGRALYNGKGIEKNHDRAEIYLRKALKGKVRGSRLLLIKLLWARGTQESCAEMCRLAAPLVEMGDPAAMGYVGRAYLYGKGADKDLSVARDLLDTAAKSDPAWKRELMIATKELQG